MDAAMELFDAIDGVRYLPHVQTGDSMEPTIRRRDVVIVDTFQDRFSGDALYLCDLGGSVRVYRLQQLLGRAGGLRVRLDNRSYDDVIVPRERLSELMIVGRAVMHLRRV